MSMWRHLIIFFFFFNDPATTEIYTLSLHDALPISLQKCEVRSDSRRLSSYARNDLDDRREKRVQDRKSTRLNSSHSQISYAVFCLKKKKKTNTTSFLLINHTVTIQSHSTSSSSAST